MVRAAEDAGLTLMVSQNYRFRRWVRTVRALLDEDEAGNPDNIAVRFASAPRFQESFRHSMEHPLVVDMSIHHFDLLRALTGLEPQSVYAVTWQPSWSWFQHHPCCMAVFQFEGGMKACYDASWVTRGRQTSSNGYWRIECPESCIELLNDRVHVLQGPGPSRDAEVEMHDLPCEDQAYSLREFQRAVLTDREPEASGRDNLNSLAMVYATLESSRTGEAVDIDEV
jgi:predicted dehydrogenase